MSTTINVSIGDGGLPARNRQQTAANRQAYVQGKASEQAAQGGLERRAADRIEAGLDPVTGRPLVPSSLSGFRRLDQQPAANRQKTGIGCLLLPSQDFAFTPNHPNPGDYRAAPALVRGYSNNLWWAPGSDARDWAVKEGDYVASAGTIPAPGDFGISPATAGLSLVHAVAAGSGIILTSENNDYNGFVYANLEVPLRPSTVPMAEFTYEALVRVATSDASASLGIGTNSTLGAPDSWGAEMQLASVDLIASAIASDPDDGGSGDAISASPSASFRHIAIAYANGRCNFYLAGSRTHQISIRPAPSNRVYLLSASLGYSEDFDENFPVPEPVNLSAIKGIRFTPGRALYRGPSFTPPTSITKLA